MNTYEMCCNIRTMLINRAAEVMSYKNWGNDFAVKRIRNFPEELKEQISSQYFNIQPSKMTDRQLESLGFGKWSEDNPMRLIPLWLFPFLAEEIKTKSISGEVTMKKSDMDNDHRFGCMAYGVFPSDIDLEARQ